MSKIAIVYWSGTGNTEAMAQAVKAGAEGAGAEAQLFAAERARGACVREIYDATKQGICVF